LRDGTQALTEALSFQTPADTVLRTFFRTHPKLGRRDRGLIAESVYAVLRRLGSYRLLAGDPKPRRLFLLGVRHHLRTLNRPLDIAASPAELDWLEHAPHELPPDAPLEVRAELPDWIVAHLRPTMSDEEILALGVGMQTPAPLDLRANTLMIQPADLVARLAASGIPAQTTPYSPLGVRVEGKPALEQNDLFASGAIEVQDEGSQLLGFLLAPRRREMVVDFCAGAGGKTLLLGAMMRSEGRLYAFDVSSARLQRLRARVARSGLSNVQAEVVSSERDTRFKRLAGKIDRVLVDAPCTGLGTLRRNPDLKWRQSPADLADLQEKQRRILWAAAKLLKPGGRLVYATCSILTEENDAVVDDFLGAHPQFRALDCQRLLSDQSIALACGERLHLLPHLHRTDGFFAAAFERVRDTPDTPSIVEG
jgi:16S rRNA (cytosine967-C5)-methyltransferase